MGPERARLILGLPMDSVLSPDQVKAAWRSAASRTHPDRGGVAEDFVLACEALRCLEGPGGLVLHRPPSRPPVAKPVRLLGTATPPPRPPRFADPGYAADQALLEEAYGRLGYWGRTGDGLVDLWKSMWCRR